MHLQRAERADKRQTSPQTRASGFLKGFQTDWCSCLPSGSINSFVNRSNDNV